MSKKSVAEEQAARALRGLSLFRERGGDIAAMPAGGLSVPACGGERRYRVSLVGGPAGEGRCGCPDHMRRKLPCKHLFAALIWSAKRRRATARPAAEEPAEQTPAAPIPGGPGSLRGVNADPAALQRLADKLGVA